MLLALLMFLLLSGCKEVKIEHYQVPKEGKPAQRLLGAIIPHGKKVWFFKLLGVQTAVDRHEKEFEPFIRSVRFTDKADPPISWTVPKEWKEKPSGEKLRYATFVLENSEPPLELTVVPLGQDAGDLLANVNRWRGQVGLPDTDQAGLGQVTRSIEVAGNTVTLVDLKSQGNGVDEEGPTSEPERPTYTLPKGWEKSTKQVQFSIATFEVLDGERVAQVTLSPFPGEAGGLRDNVDRWRRQLGLEPASEEDLKKDARKIEVGGSSGQLIDLTAPEKPETEKRRILGVVVSRRGQTWFFKMMGPADLVEKQKTAFEAFIQSVRFDGGRGAKP
jgi:hypothetical protein